MALDFLVVVTLYASTGDCRFYSDSKWWHQDSSPATARARNSLPSLAQRCRWSIQWEVLGHPPYSPDLSPCDYAISGPLKKALRGRRFTSDDNVKQYVRNWFTTQPREFYETAVHCLVSQWDKCLKFLGLRIVSFWMHLIYNKHFVSIGLSLYKLLDKFYPDFFNGYKNITILKFI